MKSSFSDLAGLILMASCAAANAQLTDHVNPLLGTATISEKEDTGFTPTRRVWGAEVFPGSSLPNAMVQLSPVTQFRSGSGYQYEDTVIQAFTHTSKGHWNLCHVPLMPVTGDIEPNDFSSPFNHKEESAKPGYYQVQLQRYAINVELTSTLRCGFHRYSFPAGKPKKVVADLTSANERVRAWEIHQEGDHGFKGFQQAGEKIYFYALSNHRINGIASLKNNRKEVSVIDFADSAGPLELRVGFSFTSIDNAKANLEKEIAQKTFDQVKDEARQTWENLLSKIKVTGGTQRQRGIFYSCLYRSFLWPALRSDGNGDFVDRKGKLVNKGFSYYTEPSLWDDYRNKLVLLGMLTPKVSEDVIQSLIDRGEVDGFMPTFFHGDHAAPYIAGTYLRGIRGFDVKRAYDLLLRNATLENRSRPFLKEYIEKSYISDPDLENPRIETKAKAGVTKTLEYAYDDYSVALLAKELNDSASHEMLMKRTGNYKNMFDPSTGLMRGRLNNGEWVKNFDPEFPYYEYMYREANAWQSSFFAPHDPKGLISLYKSEAEFEKKLDDLFTIPWKGVEAQNISGFIGQYCHGNQPDHSYPWMYYYIGKQRKSQILLNRIMDRFYDMGKDKLSYAGMDDAGEMSSWYVFSAIGLYPLSPADPEYIISVPLFDKIEMKMGDLPPFNIVRKSAGVSIDSISYDSRGWNRFFISHQDLAKGKDLLIDTK